MFSKILTHIVLGSALLAPALAHMNMMVPPPLRHRDNPNTQTVKPYYDFPLKKDGSDFPCKGYLDALDTPEGLPVATWPAGSQQMFAYVPLLLCIPSCSSANKITPTCDSLEGSGSHYGGSCQLSLSYDRGQTFKVIKSYMGSCPHRLHGGDQSFNFQIPKEAPSGDALFSW
jgi:hypothetical protein